MSSILEISAVILTMLTLSSFSFAADAAKGDNPGNSKVDQQLLDNLDSELLNDLLNDPDFQTPAPQGSNPLRPPSSPDEQRAPPLKQRGLGEDIQSQANSDPLSRVMRKMRTVEDLIDKKNTSQTTQQLQIEIVDELSELIKQCKKQCSANKSGSRAAAKKPGSAKKSTKNNAAQQNAQQSLKPKKSESSPTATLSKSEMLKEVWGHLPERVRKQMQNSSIEEFLPKYEKLIEQYYKRLAEEGTDAF